MNFEDALASLMDLATGQHDEWDYVQSHGQPLISVAQKRNWNALVPGLIYRSTSGKTYVDRLAMQLIGL